MFHMIHAKPISCLMFTGTVLCQAEVAAVASCLLAVGDAPAGFAAIVMLSLM
jgi:hypothetical protein